MKKETKLNIESLVKEHVGVETFKEIIGLDLNFLRKKMINFESKKNTIKQTKKAAK